MRDYFTHAALSVFGLIVLLAVAGCGSTGSEQRKPGWKLEGLQELEVLHVKKYGDNGELLVATDNGIYLYREGRFKFLGLEGELIEDMVVLADNSILAAIRLQAFVDSNRATIYKKPPESDTWQPFDNNWGGEYGGDLVWAFMTHPADKDIVLGLSSGNIARSIDGGASWESIFLDWGNTGLTGTFITFDPNDPSVIWVGGQNSISRPLLLKSVDDGETWTLLNREIQIFEGIFFRGVTYDLKVRSGNSSEALLAVGGVFFTGDGGGTWSDVTPDSTFSRTLAQSVRNPDTFYASGATPGLVPFFVSTSTFGRQWEKIEFESYSGGEDLLVNEIVSIMTGGREVLFLATRQGLYSYTFE